MEDLLGNEGDGTENKLADDYGQDQAEDQEDQQVRKRIMCT